MTIIKQRVCFPRAIFPRIPYEILLATGKDSIDYHINFITLAMLAGSPDDVYSHFDAIFSEILIMTDVESMKMVNDHICSLVECYIQFYAHWYRLTFGSAVYYIENIDHVNYLFKTPDSYVLEVCTRATANPSTPSTH